MEAVSPRRPIRGRRVDNNAGRGFTLVELVLIVALVGVISGLAFPALQNLIYRTKLEGFTRSCAVLLKRARLEAVQRGVPCVVRLDLDSGEIIAWADVDGNETFEIDPDETDWRMTDYEIRRHPLPRGVAFSAPEGQQAVDGLTEFEDFTPNAVVFAGDGSARDGGALRVADTRGNYLEVRLDPPATGQVTLRKWDGEAWVEQSEGGQTWTWH